MGITFPRISPQKSTRTAAFAVRRQSLPCCTRRRRKFNPTLIVSFPKLHQSPPSVYVHLRFLSVQNHNRIYNILEVAVPFIVCWGLYDQPSELIIDLNWIRLDCRDHLMALQPKHLSCYWQQLVDCDELWPALMFWSYCSIATVLQETSVCNTHRAMLSQCHFETYQTLPNATLHDVTWCVRRVLCSRMAAFGHADRSGRLKTS